MHPYLKHLIEDIQNAERQEDDLIAFPKPTTFEEQMQEVERYISGLGELPLSKYTGLNSQDFPPAHQLADAEMELVLMAFDKMLFTWNIAIDWPKKMPVTARYDHLLNFVLEEKVTPVNTGTMHLDFCTGYAPDCDWGTYCHCLKSWKDFQS